jgi:plastocyanin
VRARGHARRRGNAATPPATSQPLPVAGSPAPYTPATCEPSGTKLMIVAKADQFSLNCIAVAAGAPTTITLVNKDSSSHNLAIYEDPGVGVLMPAGDAYPALFPRESRREPGCLRDPATHEWRVLLPL